MYGKNMQKSNKNGYNFSRVRYMSMHCLVLRSSYQRIVVGQSKDDISYCKGLTNVALATTLWWK